MCAAACVETLTPTTTGFCEMNWTTLRCELFAGFMRFEGCRESAHVAEDTADKHSGGKYVVIIAFSTAICQLCILLDISWTCIPPCWISRWDALRNECVDLCVLVVNACIQSTKAYIWCAHQIQGLGQSSIVVTYCPIVSRSPWFLILSVFIYSICRFNLSFWVAYIFQRYIYLLDI